MTNSELKRLWNETINKCPKDKFSSVKIDAWYKPLSPLRIDDEKNIIYFTTTDSNPMIKSMIMKKSSYDVIKPSIANIFGKEYKLELIDESEATEHAYEPDGEYIDSHYTFESFVSGANNRFALATSLAIAEQFTPDYNPLFIYGGSGLGKTHLLSAIAHFVQQNNPEKKVVYVTTEAFTNELIKAIKENSTVKFHERYRQADILLLDDIQFIADKASTQEEVFNTFNSLYAANKQIVISSDKPPKDLMGLPARLISRFSQGMIADIQPPDYETRVAILQQKLEDKGIEPDDDIAEVLDFIAQNVTDNIRELEGALNKVTGFASFSGKKITKEFAKGVLSEIFHIKEREITPENIKKSVAEFFGIKVSDIEGSKRTREIVYPRQVAIYLIRNHTSLSLPQIGKEFGGRDHTTIMHSCEKIEEELIKNESLKEKIKKIESQFNS